jgi:hypothetical protein
MLMLNLEARYGTLWLYGSHSACASTSRRQFDPEVSMSSKVGWLENRPTTSARNPTNGAVGKFYPSFVGFYYETFRTSEHCA